MADEARLARARRHIRILGACLLLLLFATAWVLFRPGGLLVRPAPQLAEIGVPFALTAHTGETLTERDLAGKPFTVFFGFTHCPEVCPTTLWEMSQSLDELGPEADGLRVLFVSVDPERDTPDHLARYLQSFDQRIVGLTGSEQQIAEVGMAYRAYWRKVPTEDDDYTMDHTASVYLMDSNGRFAGTIAYEEDAATRLAKLRNLLRG